jgi:hypothetical protein
VGAIASQTTSIARPAAITHRSTRDVTAPTTISCPSTIRPSVVMRPRFSVISRAGAPPLTSTTVETRIVRGQPTGTPSSLRLTAPSSSVLRTNQMSSKPETTRFLRELPAEWKSPNP